LNPNNISFGDGSIDHWEEFSFYMDYGSSLAIKSYIDYVFHKYETCEGLYLHIKDELSQSWRCSAIAERLKEFLPENRVRGRLDSIASFVNYYKDSGLQSSEIVQKGLEELRLLKNFPVSSLDPSDMLGDDLVFYSLHKELLSLFCRRRACLALVRDPKSIGFPYCVNFSADVCRNDLYQAMLSSLFSYISELWCLLRGESDKVGGEETQEF